MNSDYYFMKEINCPVCKNTFNIVKVKSKVSRLIKRDEDFCPYYEPINILFYTVWVCPECGYAAMEDRFEKISDWEIQKVKEKIKSKWNKRNFPEERTIETAIEMYKLALLNLEVMNAPNSDIAKVCIRLAWLYRYLNDPKEKVFLQYALDNYLEAYQRENFPVDNLDLSTCMYMIGELNRRLGNTNAAAQWFYNVIASENSDKAKKTDKDNKAKVKMVINMAKEQLQRIREAK